MKFNLPTGKKIKGLPSLDQRLSQEVWLVVFRVPPIQIHPLIPSQPSLFETQLKHLIHRDIFI